MVPDPSLEARRLRRVHRRPHSGTLPVAFVSDLADALFHDVLVPLVRYPIDTAVALVQGSRSRKVWIEAICWDLPPYREMIVWRTTDEHYRRIVNEISFALQEGEIAEPLGAVREYKRGRIDES